MNKHIILIIFSCLFSATTLSQEVYHFTKGLAANVPNRYGREAVYTDELAWQLYNHTLKTPVDGGIFGENDNGQPVKWDAITADSANQFRVRGGFRGSSYLYLTYTSRKVQTALLNVQGNGSLFFNGESHTGDAYRSGWLYIPVQLKKGLNELYIRGGFITARLVFPKKPVSVNTEDATLPFIVPGQPANQLQGTVVIINASSKAVQGYRLKSVLAGKEVETDVPVIPPMSSRKVPFTFNGSGIVQQGQHDCLLVLSEKGKTIDEKKISVDAVSTSDKYSSTFISGIDGSLQYYAVTPQIPSTKPGDALFLSVHGAGVEAIGQARAYKPKDWGTLVAATNRRPRGFNWEDWGRLDALEVLEIARQKFKPDPSRIYLTGHSMGGHGTWFLGATYPDKWAGIGPCAGYPTLRGYGSADGLIPDSSRSVTEQVLLRASNQSDVLKLVNNYKPLGIYILHGDADRVVPVRYARQMRAALAEIHGDFSYYEYPGGEHWFGDQSVDWKPLFEYFKWHTRLPDSAVDHIEFTTASPGISATYRWATIYQQVHPLEFSTIKLDRNKQSKTIRGSTENILLLQIDLADFGSNTTVSITLDNRNSIKYTTRNRNDIIYLHRQNDQWVLAEKPAAFQKGPHRYGTLKDAFNNRMLFVYGTTGYQEENEWSYNKARYDAETWYYRGNGAVDIISDKEYMTGNYNNRGVIVFGNAETNAAWKLLLQDCPIQVSRNKITAGKESFTGNDIAAYYVWPLKDSPFASVAAIGGTGIKGMQAANGNQYFAGASGFPDFMIFGLNMLKEGIKEVKMAGYFDNEWKLVEREYVAGN